jgi:NADH dehydrogenase [ubiquinone] 1 alpha subcomplex assembly factor 6
MWGRVGASRQTSSAGAAAVLIGRVRSPTAHGLPRQCVRLAHGSSADRRYCLDMVRRHDREGHLCTLLLPDEASQERARAIRAFNVEVALIREAAREPATRAMRYQFWLDAVDSAFAGAPARHPVALCLADAVQAQPMSARLLKEAVRARAVDVKGEFETVDAFEDHADSTVTAVLLLLLESAAARTETVDRAACHVGRAVATAALLRSAPFLLAAGETRFPRDLQEKHIPDRAVLRRGSTSPELEELAFALGSIANSHLENARRIVDMGRDAKLQLLPAVACQRYLDHLQHAGFDLCVAPSLLPRQHRGS